MRYPGPAFSFYKEMNKEKRPENITLNTVAVIPAAGAGVRMGGDRGKQFLDLDGKPLLAITLEKFQVCPAVESIIVVVPSGELDYCQKEIIEQYNLTKVGKVVPGGERRQDSVRLGIEASGGDYGLVLIHDGVRPLIPVSLIERVVKAAREYRAVITALPAKETVKKIDKDGRVIKTYDRRQVRLAQTPQVFRYQDIMMAHRLAIQKGLENVTDDALLIEKSGIPIKIIEGSEDNIKVTTPHDLDLVRFLLRKNRS